MVRPTKELAPKSSGRRPWEPMRIVCLGNVGDVLKAGIGKISLAIDDPGEAYKKPHGLDN